MSDARWWDLMKDKRAARGQCLTCSSPARPKRLLCAECAKHESLRQLRRTGRMRYTRHCGECRELGHNVQNCPRVPS